MRRSAALAQAALLHARVALVLLVLPLALRHWPVQQVVRRLTPTVRPAPAPWGEAERAALAVDRLFNRRPLRHYGPCLRRSLTLYYLLSRLGYPVRVALGAYPAPDGLQAHAWLTLDARPIFEAFPVERYALMAEWGGDAREVTLRA